MNTNRLYLSILQALNIRQEERKYVQHLFLHYFFQGFAMALLFTVANTYFLAHYPISSLPVVYVLAAAVMLATGRLYAYLEHHLPLRRLMVFIVLALAVSVMLFFLGVRIFHYTWIGIGLMVGYRTLYLLSSLEFWGISALLFDVRQGKRLFGLISVGDVPAKLLGYLSVAVLVPVMGLENLLLLAAVAFLSCLFFIRQITQQTDLSVGDHQAEEHHHPASDSGDLIGKIFKSDFIIVLAGLSLVFMASVTLVEYSFLSTVQATYQTEEELARFISLFFGFGYGVTFLSKLFLSGRIIDQWGVRAALLVLPGLLLTAALTFLLAEQVVGQYTTLLGVFALMMLITDTFRRVLHEPTFLALFQPLPRQLRLHGHTVVKGLVDPIGLGLMGLLLLFTNQLFGEINLVVVTYVLIPLVVGWLGLVAITYRQYLRLLVSAIAKRFLPGSSLIIKDKNALQVLSSRLTSSFPEEAIYALELIQKSNETLFRQSLVTCLQHPLPEVRLYTLRKIEHLKVREVSGYLTQMVAQEEAVEVKEAAIRALCAVDEEATDLIQRQLEDEDIRVRKGAITGLLKSGDVESMVLAGQQLLQLIRSDRVEEKTMAASMLGDLGFQKFYKPLAGFMEDPDAGLRTAAIEASACIRNPHLLPYLRGFLDDPAFFAVTLNSLAAYGDAAVEMLHQEVQELPKPDKVRVIRIIKVCGRIASEQSERLLISLLAYPDVSVVDEVLKALKQIKYKAPAPDRDLIFQHLDQHLFQAYQCIHLLQQFQEAGESVELLSRAIRYKLRNIRERVFAILTFLYDSEVLAKANAALDSGQKEKRANALEMLDNLLDKKVQPRLFPFIEELPVSQQLAFLSAQFGPLPTGSDYVFEEILTEGSRSFSTWIQAAALFCLPAQERVALPLVLTYLEHPKKILRQNALVVLQRWGFDAKAGSQTALPPSVFAAITDLRMKTAKDSAGSLLEIEKVLILRRTSMFGHTPESVLADLAGIIQEERVPAGKTIFEKGDLGKCMYIIYEGEVKIHAGDLELACLGNRDFFGELALLDPEPRSASATASIDTFLLRIDQQAFFELVDERPEVGKGILKILCQRLRRQNNLISELKGHQAVSVS